MKDRAMEREQSELPFGEAEASYAERRNELGLALLTVEADLYLKQLSVWVFEVSAKGAPLKKTYKQLAGRPWGLCCSASKARATAMLAEDLGLIAVTRNRFANRGQDANSYVIDWLGVSKILRRQGVSTRQPPASTEHPPVLIEHPPVLIRHHNKETKPLTGTSLRTSVGSGTGPEAGAEPGPWTGGQQEAKCGSAVSTCTAPALAAGPATDADALRAELVEDHPLLRDARQRPIAAMPPGDLVGSAFAPLRETSLANGSLAIWYRRQLGLRNPPVRHATEADLLLVLAAGLYAARLPANQIKRNRIALFVDTVLHGKWRRAASHVRDAAKLLAEIAESHPEAVQYAEARS